jgi:hypothetical protein
MTTLMNNEQRDKKYEHQSGQGWHRRQACIQPGCQTLPEHYQSNDVPEDDEHGDRKSQGLSVRAEPDIEAVSQPMLPIRRHQRCPTPKTKRLPLAMD